MPLYLTLLHHTYKGLVDWLSHRDGVGAVFAVCSFIGIHVAQLALLFPGDAQTVTLASTQNVHCHGFWPFFVEKTGSIQGIKNMVSLLAHFVLQV